MAKDEFDMDFDFEKEYDFDLDEFLDSDLDADIDFSEFDDAAEQPVQQEADALSEYDLGDLNLGDVNLADFDLDDLNLDDLGLSEESTFSEDVYGTVDFSAEEISGLNFGEDDFAGISFDANTYQTDAEFSVDLSDLDLSEGFAEEQAPVLDFAFDAPAEYPSFELPVEREPEFVPAEPVQEEPEFIVGSRNTGFRDADDEEDFDATDFDEADFENTVYGRPLQHTVRQEPVIQEPVFQPAVEEQPVQKVPAQQPVSSEEPAEAPRRRERSEKRVKSDPVRKEKPAKPERAPAGPNIFTKFLAFYLSPLKEDEKPQDPNSRRRRKKRTKMQIFKEVYLPPVIAGVTLILLVSLVIGAISTSVAQKKLDDQAALRESQAEAEQAAQQEEEAQRIMAEADRLAMGYDYQGAIDMINSYTGEMTQEMNEKRAEYVNIQNKLVEWKDYSSIPNLSFHVLIADPARAFADKDLGGQYNRNFVTIDEFSKILEQLYRNGYVLVDFDSFTETNTGLDGKATFFTKPIALPEGKKPIMITETMVNYYSYMVDSNKDGEPDAGGDGFAYRLIVDENGEIKAQMVDANGQTQTGNFDLVPILEDFIKEHPDFVYQGARAILAVSGSEGVFGYRTNTSYISTVGQSYYDEQVAGAKTIVQALRDKGYTIACYTYDNIAYGQKSATQIQADMQEWTNQITPVIGQVDVLVYARTSDIGDYSGAKFQVLSGCGFRFFLKHGSEPYAEVNNTYVRQTRLMVTGENLAWNSSQFSKYFDCAAIINNTRGNVPKG